MKKSFLAMGLLAMIVAGCNKERPEQIVESPRHLTVDIDVSCEAPGTRAVKRDWEEGDKVYVVFDDKFGDGSRAFYMIMSYDGTSWTSAFSDPALEEYLLEKKTGTLAAAYWSDLEPVFRYQDRELEVVNGYNAPGVKLLAEKCKWEVTEDRLTSALTMAPFSFSVHFSIEGVPEADARNFTFRNEYVVGLDIIGFLYSDWDGKAVEGFESIPEDGIKAGYYNGLIFYGALNAEVPNESKDYIITVTDDRGTDTTIDDIVYTLPKTATLRYKDAIKLPSLDSGRWNITVTPNINGHEYVDMGNGLKWATTNLGATTPEGYGSYYAWGETFTKDTYTSSNYTYTDKPAVLPAAEDAATVIWESTWRIPTQDEWDWLWRNCVWTKTTTKNGVNGYTAKSKINGNSIFFPAAGYHVDGDYYGDGELGYYWASTRNDLLVDYTAGAFNIHYLASTTSLVDFECYGGLTIRPVSN